jgi:hypothetical protein
MSASSTLAASHRFRTFAVVFALTIAVFYVVCDVMNWPLFSFHPATNRVDLGWGAPRRGEGPVMYWYGWTALCLIVGAALGGLATLLPERMTARIPLTLTWLVPILAFIPLAYALMPFWTR